MRCMTAVFHVGTTLLPRRRDAIETISDHVGQNNSFTSMKESDVDTLQPQLVKFLTMCFRSERKGICKRLLLNLRHLNSGDLQFQINFTRTR